jgi:hypothetical protein
MRLAEREMLEIDRKQQAVDSANSSTSSLPQSDAAATAGANTSTPEDHLTSNERMVELVKQITEEARRLAATRAELQKAKKQQAELLEAEKPVKGTPGKKKSAATTTPTAAPEPAAVASAVDSSSAAEATHKGTTKMAVPDHLLPELCR